jgi:hypothetical protein
VRWIACKRRKISCRGLIVNPCTASFDFSHAALAKENARVLLANRPTATAHRYDVDGTRACGFSPWSCMYLFQLCALCPATLVHCLEAYRTNHQLPFRYYSRNAHYNTFVLSSFSIPISYPSRYLVAETRMIWKLNPSSQEGHQSASNPNQSTGFASSHHHTSILTLKEYNSFELPP